MRAQFQSGDRFKGLGFELILGGLMACPMPPLLAPVSWVTPATSTRELALPTRSLDLARAGLFTVVSSLMSLANITLRALDIEGSFLRK